MPATKGPTKTVQFRDFSGGINRTASRTGMKDNELFASENVQPIGPGILQILPPPGPAVATISAGIASIKGFSLKIGGAAVGRLITVNNDGSMSAIDPGTGIITVIGGPGTVTPAARTTMWQDTPLLIGDPTKGFFSWDGTTLNDYPIALTGTTTINSPTVTAVSPNTTGLAAGMSVVSPNFPVGTTILTVISPSQLTLSANASASGGGVALTIGSGSPTSVKDVQTFEGRAALLTGSRSITLTAPASFTDFITADGSITTPITDSIFEGAITRLLSALELLWIVGPDAINAISNVQTTGSVTTLSNTNIVANVGTLLPSSVASFFRTFLFLAPYGVYAIVGATPQKLSDNLDGLFPLLSFGPDAPADVFTVNNVFVWAVLVTLNDLTTGPRPVLLCFARNAWFMVSQGALTGITSLLDPTTGNPNLWGTDGTNIFRCFAGTGPGPYTVRTKLWDFGAFTQRKQVTKLAVEFNSPNANPVSAAVTVENESGNAIAPAVGIIPQNTLVFIGA